MYADAPPANAPPQAVPPQPPPPPPANTHTFTHTLTYLLACSQAPCALRPASPESSIKLEAVDGAAGVELVVQGGAHAQHGYDASGGGEGIWQEAGVHAADDLQEGLAPKHRKRGCMAVSQKRGPPLRPAQGRAGVQLMGTQLQEAEHAGCFASRLPCPARLEGVRPADGGDDAQAGGHV